MKKNVHAKWFPVVAGIGLITGISAQAAPPVQALIYDNSSTPLNSYFASQTEFGDQITPQGGGWIAHTFTFEYFASGLGGGETGVLRFYANDGAASAPGTVLYQSPSFNLINGNIPVTVTDLQPLNVLLPKTFTWAIAPSGVAAAETFGLKLYDPPTIGSSFDDVWQFDGAEWALKQTPGFVANFGATLTAVPEPGVLTLLGLGAAALLLRRSSRR